MTRCRLRRASGFTLFEVLAASLILVLVGTVAIGSMNADLARMGEARQRLEAGRVADLALADMEALLFDGSAPGIQNEEEEIDGFLVKTLVTPLGLLFARDDDANAAPAAAPGGEPPAPDFFPLVANEFPGLPKHMRMIRVEVYWGDPARPESVQRTTLAFDHAAALEAVQNLGPGNAAGAGNAAGDRDR